MTKSLYQTRPALTSPFYAIPYILVALCCALSKQCFAVDWLAKETFLVTRPIRPLQHYVRLCFHKTFKKSLLRGLGLP